MSPSLPVTIFAIKSLSIILAFCAPRTIWHSASPRSNARLEGVCTGPRS